MAAPFVLLGLILLVPAVCATIIAYWKLSSLPRRSVDLSADRLMTFLTVFAGLVLLLPGLCTFVFAGAGLFSSTSIDDALQAARFGSREALEQLVLLIWAG